MSDQPWETNDYLNFIGVQVERVADALERVVELLSNPPVRQYEPLEDVLTWPSRRPVPLWVSVGPRKTPTTITC